MPNYDPIPPADAAVFASDIVSRMPAHLTATDDDRARLTAALTDFLSRCDLATDRPPAPSPPTDKADA